MEAEKLYYTETHEWLALEGDSAVIGISNYAAGEINDIVFIDLPQPGKTIRQGNPFGVIESVKAVFDLNAPASGEIIAVNQPVTEKPELVSQSPLKDGWLIKITVKQPEEIKNLMDYQAYQAFLKKEKH